MKSNRLLRALGQIDDELIEEAAPAGEKSARKAPWKWISIAACFVLVAAVGIGVWQGGFFKKAPAETTNDKKWPLKVIQVPSSSSEAAIIPRWEEQTVSEQYSEIKLNSVRYSARNAEINPENIGAFLGETTSTGTDVYTEEVHSKDAAIYEIKNISAKCAVAVKFSGRTDYYVYVNSWYQPETLGDLITDLNLKETLSFGSVYYNWVTEDKPLTIIEFVDLEDTKVWEMLLSDESLRAVQDDRSYADKMSVGVNIPLLGYENISLWVTEDGYLVTNILESAKVFYLGTDKTEQFVNYVIDNCEGYELVYENSNPIPE